MNEQELRAFIERVLDEREQSRRKARRALWLAVFRHLCGIASAIKKECLDD